MNKNTLGYKLVQGWIDTVSEHDIGPILEWYDKDAILLGTLAPEPLVGIEEIESYFEMFVEYEPEAEITYIYQQRLGVNVIVCDGNYTFELNDDEGGREMVDARFTYVFKRDDKDGEWYISTHHSSVNPEE